MVVVWGQGGHGLTKCLFVYKHRDGPGGGSDDLAGQYGPYYGSGGYCSFHCYLDGDTIQLHSIALVVIMTRVKVRSTKKRSNFEKQSSSGVILRDMFVLFCCLTILDLKILDKAVVCNLPKHCSIQGLVFRCSSRCGASSRSRTTSPTTRSTPSPSPSQPLPGRTAGSSRRFSNRKL